MDGYNARANTYSTTLSSSARFVLLRPVSFYLPPTPTGLNRHSVSRMLEKEGEKESRCYFSVRINILPIECFNRV